MDQSTGSGQEDSITRTGLFGASGIAKLAVKARRYLDQGLSESDEMAVVGVLSTMLLYEQFVRNPDIAPRATATRTVIGNAPMLQADP